MKFAVSLAPVEKQVLKVLFKSSRRNGHDFGFVEDARSAVKKAQLSGAVSSLVQKKVIIDWKNAEELKRSTGYWVGSQFEFIGKEDPEWMAGLEAALQEA